MPPPEGAADATVEGAATTVDPTAVTPAQRAYINATEFYRVRELGKAIENFERATELDPMYVDPLYGLGRIYLVDTQEFDKALAMYERAKDLAPGDAFSHSSLAYAYFVMGRYQDCVDEYVMAVQIKRDDADAFLNLGYGAGGGRLLEARRFQPVTMTLREAIERRDPNGDGKATARDVSGVLHGAPTVGSYGIHVLAARAVKGGGPALVVELNATGDAVRTGSRSAVFGTDTLAVTNHLQILDEPVSCRRYQTLAKRSKRRDLDEQALWEAARATVLGTATIQTMLYVPAAGRLRLWFRPPGFDGKPGEEGGVRLDLPALFGVGGTE